MAPGRRLTFAAITAITAITAVVPSVARAGNDDGVLIGNEAAVSAGALTSTVNDGTSLWYNPAGLGLAHETSADVTGTAFMLRWYRVPDFAIASTGQREDADVVEIISIPSALTFVRPLSPELSLGLGVFVPQQNDVVVRTNLSADDGTNSSTLRLAVADTSSVYYFGGGLGWAITERVRIGLGIFAVYASTFGSSQFWGSFSGPDTEAFVGASALTSVKLGGFEARLGVQVEPIDGLVVGLSIESPDISILEAVDIDSTTGAAAVVGTDPFLEFTPEDESSLEFDASVITPMRLRLGIGYTWRDGWVAVDGDIQPGFENAEFGIDRAFTWNLRVGGRLHLFDKVSGGAGLFTDRSADPGDAQFGGLGADFYGLTLGIHFNRSYGLSDDEEEDEVVFSSSIGFRYAVGFGDVGGLLLDPGGAELVSDRPTSITVHEFSLHIGSALYL